MTYFSMSPVCRSRTSVHVATLGSAAGLPLLGQLGSFDGTAWHHIDLLLDMATQTYNLSLDGTLLGSNLAFCGSNAGCSGAVVPRYGDGFFDSFGTGNDSGYMDNYRVANATPVPEPTSLSMIAAGLVFGLGLFRRSAFPRPVWH